MYLDKNPQLKQINNKDINELNKINIELPKEEEEEEEVRESDPEKKGDDGVPDLGLSSKVSLHSDKKVTESLLAGDEAVNFESAQNSNRKSIRPPFEDDDVTRAAKNMKLSMSGSGYKPPKLNISNHPAYRDFKRSQSSPTEFNMNQLQNDANTQLKVT